MITLITGLPGNGKTLFALSYIKAKAEKEGREVYYHGISQLTLPWTEFKAEDWPTLPDGSMVVIDESQFIFPRKPNGAQLPEHYEKLAVHRHKGLDIYLITQHPTLLDNFVRKLVGQHFHAVRKFGFERSTIYEWSAANPAPETVASQKSAIPLKWSFDKKAYDWYKSAEVHTVKKRIPAKVVMVGVLVVAVIGSLFWFVQHYGSRGKNPDLVAGTPAGVGSGGTGEPGVVGSPGGLSKRPDPLEDLKDYAWRETPRVSGLPQTAPKYDELTKPVRVPVPAACIQVGQAGRSRSVSCKCYTQQGTPMEVEFNMCVAFARNGYFQDFDPDRDRKEVERTDRGVAALSERPDRPIRENYGAPQVLAFAEINEPRIQGARPPPDLNDGPPNGRPTRTAVAE